MAHPPGRFCPFRPRPASPGTGGTHVSRPYPENAASVARCVLAALARDLAERSTEADDTEEELMTATFDPQQYKRTTKQQWEDAAEAWHRWGPTLESWLGEATELMLDD